MSYKLEETEVVARILKADSSLRLCIDRNPKLKGEDSFAFYQKSGDGLYSWVSDVGLLC